MTAAQMVTCGLRLDETVEIRKIWAAMFFQNSKWNEFHYEPGETAHEDQ